MANCGCYTDASQNTTLDCATIDCKQWYDFHVPSELFDSLNNYVGLVKEYLYRDRSICECDFTTESNHIGLKVRLLLRQFEDQVNALGSEFVDLQKVLCKYIAEMDEALDKADNALKQAEEATRLANEVFTGYNEFKDSVTEEISKYDSRISALESGQTDLQTALNNEISARQSAINAEKTARENAISAEATARQNAINDEASQRSTAVSNEATARQTADTALGNRITALEGKEDKDTTYTMSFADDTLTLNGSDGSTNEVGISSGAPEATSADVLSIFE